MAKDLAEIELLLGPDDLLEITLGNIKITEDGVALALTHMHRDHLLYDHETGTWYEWCGDRWVPDKVRRVYHYCRELSRKASRNMPLKDQEKTGRAAFASGAERLARADPAHATTRADWDADPWLLGCPGKTVDLSSGQANEPQQDDRITKQTAVAPADDANCLVWLEFLRKATGGDEEMIAFLKQWCGYCLTGITREHALIFLYGPGGNGKSVFLNTISGIMGDYAATASMNTFTASRSDRHPTDLAMLHGARLVTSSETEAGRAWAESRIKQMTGGDPITARFMRQDFFTYTPSFKLTIVGNHQPVLQNVDDAAKRRFNIIPFKVKPKIPDTTLEDKLRKEWPQILRWMIDGCLEWQKHGLCRSQSVLNETADYFSEQDFMSQWLEETCVVEPDNCECYCTAADLYRSWREYAKAGGEEAGSQKSLGGKLARLGLRKGQKKILKKNCKVWIGVRFRKYGE